MFVLHHEDSVNYDWVHAWILKWKLTDQLRVVDYFTSGKEHIWDIEADLIAIVEVPESYLCASEWATPEIFLK